MQKPSEHHKFTSDNNIITFKKPVHDPFNSNTASFSLTPCWWFPNEHGVKLQIQPRMHCFLL